MAFFPAELAGGDSLVQASLVQPARTAATAAGWTFVVRWSGEIRIRDPDWQAQYSVRLAADSLGLLLLAPGRVPELIYRVDDVHQLSARLRARGGWPPDRPSRRGAGI